MAQLEKRQFQPCEHWPCGLPPIASIMANKCRRNLKKPSRLHEPLAIGEGDSESDGKSLGKTGLIVGSNELADTITRSLFMTTKKLVLDSRSRSRRKPASGPKTCNRSTSRVATTPQLELRDRQLLQPSSLCMNTTAYLSPSGP